MFVVAQRHLFWWPVTVQLPNPDAPGELFAASFEMRFEALPLDRARAIDAARNALPAEEREGRRHDFLFAVSHDWRDVVDDTGTPIPFTRETFEAFLQVSWHRQAVIEAYTEAMSGQAARLGNSAERRAH